MIRKSLMILAVAIIVAPHARTYYVAKNGNDGNNPCTINAPWLTIAKAANTLTAGDTVLIRAGAYNERLQPANSGTANARIHFSAYPGESVTLQGDGLGGQGIVFTNGKDYLSFFGLRTANTDNASNRPETGFWIINSSYVTIRGCYTYNTESSGIIVSEQGADDHIYIDSNKVEKACNDGAQECISIAKCNTFEITRNEVFNGGPGTNGGEGIDCKFGSSNGKVAYNYVHNLSRQGLYADAWSMATSNIEYCGNIVHDCQFGLGAASEQGGTLTGITFHDNVVYNTDGPGMYILMSAGPMGDLYFVNNTVHNTGTGWGQGMWFNGPQAANVIVRNNIFSGLSGQPFYVQAAPSSWTVDHNLAATAQSGQASGFIIGTPQYVNSTGGDFHLKSGSPGIDAGSSDTKYATSLGDLDRKNRIIDGDCNGTATIDMGAYEYQSPCATGIAPRQIRQSIKPSSSQQSRLFDARGRAITPGAGPQRTMRMHRAGTPLSRAKAFTW